MDIILVVLFGLCIGSFLNVCIYRVPRQLSIASPARSFCPKCNTQLTARDNVPVVSWLLLRGRCRNCGEKISPQYPLVEALTALAAVMTHHHFGFTITGFLIFTLVAALIVISFIDLEFKIIPNVISFPGITAGLLLGIVAQYTDWLHWPLTSSAWDSLLGMFVGGGFFFVIGWAYYFATKRVGLGGGDIKLMGMTGAILGVSSVAPTIFAGSLIGSVVGFAIIVFKREGRHYEIPFGPWLSLGAVLYVFADIGWFQ